VAVDVRAELVGTVWKVLVKPGDNVEADQELIVLESMKMEISVVAPRAGIVREVRVKETEVVAENQVLVVLS
jgi:acetyl-CoA carboxylase biotin carboxyl carrier protein